MHRGPRRAKKTSKPKHLPTRPSSVLRGPLCIRGEPVPLLTNRARFVLPPTKGVGQFRDSVGRAVEAHLGHV